MIDLPWPTAKSLSRGSTQCVSLIAAAEPLWDRLSKVQRAQLLMALLGLMLLALLMLMVISVGARVARRWARDRSQPTRLHDDDWYRKPLIPPDAGDDPPRDVESSP